MLKHIFLHFSSCYKVSISFSTYANNFPATFPASTWFQPMPGGLHFCFAGLKNYELILIAPQVVRACFLMWAGSAGAGWSQVASFNYLG